MSDQQFYIKNEKGLFYHTHVISFIPVDTVNYLRDRWLETVTDEKKKKKYEEVLNILSEFPTRNETTAITKTHPDFAVFGRIKKEVPHYYWVNLGRGPVSNSGVPCPYGTVKDMGLEAMIKFTGSLTILNSMLSQAKLPQINDYYVNTSASLKTKVKSLIIESHNPIEAMCSTQSFAIFCGDNFLDQKGYWGPLSRARAFESAAAAQRTANSHGIGDWTVVELSVQLKRVCQSKQEGVIPDKLGAALSYVESKVLEEALEKASIERIKASLAQKESQESQSEVSEEKPKARSNRI